MKKDSQNWFLVEDWLSNQDGLVHHQISSFNDFVENGIRDVIDHENTVKIEHDTYSYNIVFSNPYVGSPKIIESNRELKEIYPTDCRLRDLTYSSPVYVDITETTTFENNHSETNVHKRVIIAYIPIMLRSSKCRLFGLSKKRVIEKNECPWDRGGYFIVKGKERVLVSQMRGIYNRILVHKSKPHTKFLYTAEMATKCTLDASQLLGGNGYINEYPTGRLLRDAKLYEIGAAKKQSRYLYTRQSRFCV